jgi:hypothetical protein
LANFKPQLWSPLAFVAPRVFQATAFVRVVTDEIKFIPEQSAKLLVNFRLIRMHDLAIHVVTFHVHANDSPGDLMLLLEVVTDETRKLQTFSNLESQKRSSPRLQQRRLFLTVRTTQTQRVEASVLLRHRGTFSFSIFLLLPSLSFFFSSPFARTEGKKEREREMRSFVNVACVFVFDRTQKREI